MRSIPHSRSSYGKDCTSVSYGLHNQEYSFQFVHLKVDTSSFFDSIDFSLKARTHRDEYRRALFARDFSTRFLCSHPSDF